MTRQITSIAALEAFHKYLFDTLGLPKITRRDGYVVDYNGKFFYVKLTKKTKTSVVVWVARGIIPEGKGFEELTSFDPSKLTIAERREYVRFLSMTSKSQQQMAEWLDVSQGTISKDINYLRSQYKKD